MMIRKSGTHLEDRRVADQLIEEVGAEAAIALLCSEAERYDHRIDGISAHLRAQEEAAENALEAIDAYREKTRELKALATVLAVEHATAWHGDPARAWM